MIDFLVVTLIVAALALAAFGFVLAALGRVPGRALLIAAAVVEALLLVQVVVAVVGLVGGARPAEFGTFVGYLVAALILLPLALQWARAEANRWNGAVVGVAAVAVAAAVARLNTLWASVGG